MEYVLVTDNGIGIVVLNSGLGIGPKRQPNRRKRRSPRQWSFSFWRSTFAKYTRIPPKTPVVCDRCAFLLSAAFHAPMSLRIPLLR